MEEKFIRVLLVDDDEDDYILTRHLLAEAEGACFDLEWVTTYQAALEAMKQGKHHVCLVDYRLGDQNGLELVRIAVDMDFNAPIIMLTGKGNRSIDIAAMRFGASDYLSKDGLSAESLERAIRYAIEHKHAQEALKAANQRILDQQKSVIEEERLKVLLQMAGATAYELNHPLMSLLGNIELLRRDIHDPEELVQRIAGIEEVGQRISDIVEKIQNIRHYDAKPYADKSSIIDLDEKIVILSVEDSDDDFETIKTVLEHNNQIELFRTRSIKETVQVLEQGRFDLIFSDFFFSDGNCLDFLRVMEKKRSETPVVVITGHGDEMIAAQVIQAGAYDYLTKKRVSDKSLFRVIANTLEKARLKREIREARKKMAKMSISDQLTGLYNSRYFKDALERDLARAGRYKTDLSLCMMDLDHFKHINDNYGHPAGDMVLAEFGRMLKESARQSDLLCRYGGEEFAVILPNIQREKALAVCERFRDMFAKREFEYKSNHFRITLSAGIASLNSGEEKSAAEFLDMADQALYQAKKMGRNRVAEYVHWMSSHKPKLGEVLISEGYVTKGVLEKALSEQGLRLGDVLLQADRITAQQLDHALDCQKRVSTRLGEILKVLGYSVAEDINWALSRMKRKLGEILTEKGLLTDYQLDRVLVLQEGQKPGRT